MKKAIFWVTIGLLLLCVGVYLLFPQEVGRRLPYRFYVVLSESMEPTIPAFSLVLVRQIPSDAFLTLQPEQIITFQAERFGEEIIETHRFSHIPDASGRYFRTGQVQNPAGKYCGYVCGAHSLSRKSSFVF